MAAKDKAAKAGKAARAASRNPYVQRIAEDEELRGNIRIAFESARDAYERLANGKRPTKALLEDKKLQRELKEAAEALREAGTALRERPKKRKRGGLVRKLLILGAGAGLALALSEGLRKKVVDTLFGAEEEFDYSSNTAPSTPASDKEPAAA